MCSLQGQSHAALCLPVRGCATHQVNRGHHVSPLRITAVQRHVARISPGHRLSGVTQRSLKVSRASPLSAMPTSGRESSRQFRSVAWQLQLCHACHIRWLKLSCWAAVVCWCLLAAFLAAPTPRAMHVFACNTAQWPMQATAPMHALLSHGTQLM
jgi:hypothetical protein